MPCKVKMENFVWGIGTILVRVDAHGYLILWSTGYIQIYDTITWEHVKIVQKKDASSDLQTVSNPQISSQ